MVSFHKLAQASPVATIKVPFGGSTYDVEVHDAGQHANGTTPIVFEHPLFQPTDAGVIYHNDPDGRPFETDAGKFAFLSACAATWIGQAQSRPRVVHLHDWHSAFYLLLRAYDPAFQRLRDIRTVFTIHNLSYQGQRPLDGHASSLSAWFPTLAYDAEVVRDTQFPDCVNPMKAAIRLADALNTVSPSYAREIVQPSDNARGFVGGEGLEVDLQQRADNGTLIGILNGCFYPARPGRKPGWTALRVEATRALEGFSVNADRTLALDRVASLPKRKPPLLITSIGRPGRAKSRLDVAGHG